MDHRKIWARSRDSLVYSIMALGFPEELGELIAKQLGSPKAIDRMAAYLDYEKPDDIQIIVDEMPAYHMNKMYWITVLLDGTVPDDRVYDLLEMSYLATASSKKKEKFRGPKEWIIPANPKYYDIVHAFDDTDEIRWKQGAGIKAGDTVFMYVAAPVSAILYQCKVLETGIPWDYQDGKLTVRSLMTIKLQKRYPPDRFTFTVLKEDYGIYAVRGPRGIPNSLSHDLKK